MTRVPLHRCLTCAGSGSVRGWQSGEYRYSTCWRCAGTGRTIIINGEVRPAPPDVPWNQGTIEVDEGPA